MTAGMLLNGCIRRIPTGNLPVANPQDRAITVDVHCHIFNGTDLQMAQFIRKAVGTPPECPLVGPAEFGPLLQDINWLVAPTGKSELKKLRPGEGDKAHAQRDKIRNASYGKFRSQALASGATSEQRDALKKNYQTYLDYQRSKQHAGKDVTLVGGELSAANEYFQYRYVALADYLHLYNDASSRTMDLMIAHLLDYDWPLNNGSPTRTHLDQQIRLMEQISVLSEGRIHTFAPFDPFREIAFRAGLDRAKWSPLAMLRKDWVPQRGCIGVKIYPTMGFAPYGNSQLSPDTWSKAFDWLPDPKNVSYSKGNVATIGERLDEVLGDLYALCRELDLPLMAHTDLSNGPSCEFNRFTAADHWQAFRDRFGDLRVNFGHLGGFEDTAVTDWSMPSTPAELNVNACKLVAFMSSDPKAGGRYYGDSAYNQKVLTDRSGLQAIYKAALAWQAPGQSQPLLPDRLMYGSDWSLLMLQENMQTYFADFVTMYQQLDGPSSETLSDQFFGGNAVEYLGLREGPTRRRLLDFYAAHEMSRPTWMDKIDS